MPSVSVKPIKMFAGDAKTSTPLVCPRDNVDLQLSIDNLST